MKNGIVIAVISLISTFSYAGVCKDSDGGLIPEVAGKIVYSLGSENCLGESCYTQMIKEYDRCLDSKKLLEFACNGQEVLEKEITCSGSQVCEKGACVNK